VLHPALVLTPWLMSPVRERAAPHPLHLQVAAGVQACMEGAAELDVPLLVRLAAGSTWGSMEALEVAAPPAAGGGGPWRVSAG